ncbi:ABC transporter ATP-binding protein [Leptospira borgpetersenii serovar Hardjo-bovis]|uniref:Putative lipoprotein ABC transporter, ATP-binding protein n=1 Tax=Leptospira borgpetersenii serovar Hardjo-bovis str. Sponselee TaxID=1303729 RepID=M6BTK3_LEPBO|nr:ABC transporter ATP-binding protein [Leptospira borgpetersenii]ABJ77910.1 Lipoprotein releasing system, LolD ATPase component [Leptospira borgpetersenii serovar Hardjo-bovis str. L550]AMX57140.1 lipoprotein releasing system, LolD ATPase component [Leptospira borgpetersenii serovar Hardjo]AMX60371.1 lipoprotein releasing system, LolD ATPase component [Leptospira borgpetersenii serovar Hardjo]AMX63618.1 lipoprotein releasing system, LolD ATPase component [Leptospira borgpetersenii serovar Hard
MSLIKVRNLVKNYRILDKEFKILDHLDLDVEEGEIVSVEGKSGIGKSTLLNILGSMDSSDAGEVNVCGVSLDQISETGKEKFRAEKVAFIFQHHLLLPDFTALENVSIPLLINGVQPGKAWQLSIEMLDRVGLKDRHDNFPSQLSGGESARVGVARALVAGKKLILADEPTGNLDRENSRNLMALILELQKEFRFSIVIVTHDMELASLAHKRNQMAGGKLQPI